MEQVPKQSDFKEFCRQVIHEIPASERYANDFSKMAEKMTSDEKETKEKSSKSGDLHVIQKTHIVKIKDSKYYQDLEYESDDEED
jgi:hypothetical protein